MSEIKINLSDIQKAAEILKPVLRKTELIYSNYFLSKPARATVEVSALPKEALVEIECVAEKS